MLRELWGARVRPNPLPQPVQARQVKGFERTQHHHYLNYLGFFELINTSSYAAYYVATGV